MSRIDVRKASSELSLYIVSKHIKNSRAVDLTKLIWHCVNEKDMYGRDKTRRHQIDINPLLLRRAHKSTCLADSSFIAHTPSNIQEYIYLFLNQSN